MDDALAVLEYARVLLTYTEGNEASEIVSITRGPLKPVKRLKPSLTAQWRSASIGAAWGNLGRPFPLWVNWLQQLRAPLACDLLGLAGGLSTFGACSV